MGVYYLLTMPSLPSFLSWLSFPTWLISAGTQQSFDQRCLLVQCRRDFVTGFSLLCVVETPTISTTHVVEIVGG